MSILIYWKYENFVKDTAEGVSYNFNSRQSRLHSATEIGEDVFVLGGMKKQSGFEIYLLAHLIIKEKLHNPPGFIYGNYRIEADSAKSKYFSFDEEPITPYLSKLDSITHFDDEPYKYAQAFQTIRKLSKGDTQFLRTIAKNLA
ncbi:MAG: hypothetical protein JSS81_09655 [Acidobacteria bacterium]|nr:hypothetical protein [Acidobacteriota bacterium]